jgi:hypothetical protein
MGEVRSRVYRGGVLETEDFPVGDVSEYLDQLDTMVWVDFCGPTEAQLDELAAELGLHELAVEDALGAAVVATDTSPRARATKPTASANTGRSRERLIPGTRSPPRPGCRPGISYGSAHPADPEGNEFCILRSNAERARVST